MWNKEAIAAILLRAAHTAVQLQPHIQIFEKGEVDGNSDVYTNADLQIEQNIQHALMDSNASFIGEETVTQTPGINNIAAHLRGYAHLVDPIDGTRNFINMLSAWAISIGLVHNSEFRDGGIILPILGEMLISDQGAVYKYSFTRLPSPETPLTPEKITIPTVSDHSYRSYSTENILKDHLRSTKRKYQQIGSCVAAIAKVITGSYFAYIGQVKLWDFAACIGLFRSMGMPVYYFDAKKRIVCPLPWEISEEHWVSYTMARYPLIFAFSYDDACKIVPLASNVS